MFFDKFKCTEIVMITKNSEIHLANEQCNLSINQIKLHIEDMNEV